MTFPSSIVILMNMIYSTLLTESCKNRKHRFV